MKNILSKSNYLFEEKDFIANQFIIGNGRLGYRGTLEEEKAFDRVTFNVVGVYDQYADKWRESLNLFNPLFLKIDENESTGELNAFKATNHTLTLDIEHGLFTRHTTFEALEIKCERFIHRVENIIASKIKISAKKDITLQFSSGIDEEVYEINGPHYKNVMINPSGSGFSVTGLTNENTKVTVTLNETYSGPDVSRTIIKDKAMWHYVVTLKRGEEVTITKIASVTINKEKSLNINALQYDILKAIHKKLFKKRFLETKVELVTSKENLGFHLNYSVYHLLILENERYTTSIPARGLSGQVYKGAIFWDTEIFMLPFYLATNPRFARNLILYRLKTLEGAKKKANQFGHEGAFYAWESQEDGVERCSLYNVTDAETGAPLRTYFADKQIHISADVIYGINKYLDATNDYSIFDEGALDVFVEVYRFYYHYATKVENKYHFFDVVGPDEYHERVDDNAFTNYQIKYSLEGLFYKIFRYPELKKALEEKVNLNEVRQFLSNIYLPKPNEDGIIEQFKNYFKLEDINVKTLHKRIKNPQAYLGGEKGLATKTRVIKQADVIALLALYPHLFSNDVVAANYAFYTPYTEHGSSLSNAMYGLVSSRLRLFDEALEFLDKSARIDLTTTYKLWAGGIFIGGTHPASSGGAYLVLTEGFLGLKYREGKAMFNTNLPPSISKVTLSIYDKNTLILKEFNND